MSLARQRLPRDCHAKRYSGSMNIHMPIQKLTAFVFLLHSAAYPVNVYAQDTERDAIMRGLSFVGTAGEQWIAEQECVTCHQIPSMIWSHQVAADYESSTGSKLKQWEIWATDVTSFVKPERKEDVDFDTALAANIDTAAQLLLAIPKPKNESPDEWRTAFGRKLAELQQEDGSWRACGQLPLQKRPENETHAVTTLWTSLALIKEGFDFDQDAALKFANVDAPQSIEWFAAKLLVESSSASNNPKDVIAARVRLVALQNQDGGWGWKKGEQSDALGTGYALYALKSTGTSQPRAMEAATEFLLRTQRPDGSWDVPGTKRSAKGRVTSPATDWGTAWAIIALAAKPS